MLMIEMMMFWTALKVPTDGHPRIELNPQALWESAAVWRTRETSSGSDISPRPDQCDPDIVSSSGEDSRGFFLEWVLHQPVEKKKTTHSYFFKGRSCRVVTVLKEFKSLHHSCKFEKKKWKRIKHIWIFLESSLQPFRLWNDWGAPHPPHWIFKTHQIGYCVSDQHEIRSNQYFPSSIQKKMRNSKWIFYLIASH